MAVLVGLYEEPEKPSNALEFVQSHLTSVGPQTADIEILKTENSDLKKQVEEVNFKTDQELLPLLTIALLTIVQLKAQVEDLKKQLQQKQDGAASQ